MIEPFAVSYHDYLVKQPLAIVVELVTEHEGHPPSQGPYYRIRIGDLTLYMLDARRREFQRALADAPTLSSVNPPDAIQKEDCGTAQ